MAKKKSIGRFEVGTKVQVKAGVASPEFPEVSLGGWKGVINEVASKKPPVTYVLEWDEQTLSSMPREYVERCEREGLYFRMVCLSEESLDPAG